MDSDPLEEKLLTQAPRKILVVEDHDDTRRVVVLLLESCGYDVESAGTVAEATALLAAGPFDVLVADIGLPDGSGLGLISASVNKSIKAIALTGRDEPDDIDCAVSAGFAVHLTKPADFQSLRKAVEKVLAGA